MGMNNPNPAHDRAKQAALVDARRARVASYKVRGYSIREIRAALAEDDYLNPKTRKPWSIGILTKDLKALDARWQAEAQRDFDKWKSAELERLALIEREAWAAWHRGIGQKKKTLTEKRLGGRGGGDKASIQTEELNGDPRYLSVVLHSQERRAKLLGLDAADRHEITGRGGRPIQLEPTMDLAALTDEELHQLKEMTVRAAVRTSGGGDAPSEHP
jgi:hypothetical protein